MMNTTNVESNNMVKGPVFLDIDLSENLVFGIGSITTEALEQGELVIGQTQKTHNIIDDNMVGFRIVEEGQIKRVEKIDPNEIAQLMKILQESDKKMSMPIKQSEIDLIAKQTGYKLVLKDKSLVVDDTQER